MSNRILTDCGTNFMSKLQQQVALARAGLGLPKKTESLG